MGQYYNVINIDKKEWFNTWDLDCGAKLMEFSYSKSPVVLALMNLMQNEWKGQRVYIIGDYMDESNPFEPCFETYLRVKKELEEEAGHEIPSLYAYAEQNFTNIGKTLDAQYKGWRYIYCHAMKLYIDLEKCPIEWVWFDEKKNAWEVSSVSPLALLLAMGNERGGGDYHEGNNNFEAVGSWCAFSNQIDISDKPIREYNYEEYRPNFTENKEIIPWTDKDRAIEQELKRREQSYVREKL